MRSKKGVGVRLFRMEGPWELHKLRFISNLEMLPVSP